MWQRITPASINPTPILQRWLHRSWPITRARDAWIVTLLVGVASYVLIRPRWSTIQATEIAIAVTAALLTAISPNVVCTYRAATIRSLQKCEVLSLTQCRKAEATFWAIAAALMGWVAVLNLSALAALAWFTANVDLEPLILARAWLPIVTLAAMIVWTVADTLLVRALAAS